MVQTWTRRTVAFGFRDYIYKRFAGYDERPISREAGVSIDAITFNSLGSVPYAPQIEQQGVLSVDGYRWRIPYEALDPWTPTWNELVETGFAATVGSGWTLTERGVTLCEQIHRRARAYLESLSLPSDALSRLVVALGRLHNEIPSGAERAQCARTGLPLQHEIHSDIVRFDRFASELWNFRDDAHIAAWQKAGYAGPTIDVLSHVWEGIGTMSDLVSELEGRQLPSGVHDEVDRLVEVGDFERHGDSVGLTALGKQRREAVEAQTDSFYFQGWPEGDALQTIGDDLAAVIDAVPGS